MQSSGGPTTPANPIDRYLPGLGQDDGSPSSAYGPSLIDISAIRAFIWRQRYILIGVTTLVLIAGLVTTLLMKPMYEASSTLQLSVDSTQIVEGQQYTEETVGTRNVDFYLRTLSEVIKSRSMAHKVVDSLELHNNEEFLASMFKNGRPNGATDEAWEQSRRNAAAARLVSDVEVVQRFDSSVFAITFRSESRSLAAAIANGYADAVLVDSIERDSEANAYARNYLEEQITETQLALQEAEIQAISYARQNRIVGTGGQAATAPASGATSEPSVGTSVTITGSNVEGINQAYIDARSRLIAAEQRWRAVAGASAASLPEVLQNANIQALRSRRAQLEGELSDLRERYREDYPAIREAQSEIDTLDTQIAQSSAEVKETIRGEYLIAQRQSQALATELERVTDVALDEQDRRVQYNLIDRDVAALRTQLTGLLDRYNQISSASNLRSSGLTIIDPAVTPGAPISPNLWRNLLLALVLGGGLAVVLALLREVFDDRLRSVEELERKLGVKSLGQIPDAGSDLADLLEDPFSPVSEAYSSIRATLDYTLGQKKNFSILVTSTQASEGKTTTSIALAKKFAKLGRKVLLVDVDLRRPSLQRSLGLERPRAGIVDVLFSRVPLADAVFASVEENLDVLAVGEIPNNPVEIMSSGLFPEFVEKHRLDYDVMVFDSSPVLGIADAPLLARHSDGVVFVLEANRTNAGEGKAALRRLRQVEANIVGVILAKYRALNAGQNYRYQYQYYSYDSKE